MARVSHSGSRRLAAPIGRDEFDDTEVELRCYREVWIAKLQLYARVILSGSGAFGMTFEEAVDWMNGPDFHFTCEMIGIDPAYTRAKLMSRPKDPSIRDRLSIFAQRDRPDDA